MKRFRLLVFVLSFPLIFVGGIWFCMGPLHDWQGKKNTQYSYNFSLENFSRITNGMTPATVTNLLGEAFGSAMNDNFPGWGMNDSTGHTYPSNINVRIEWLYFSKPKKSSLNYEWVQVVLGPNRTVIDKNSYVTD